jgi:gamma-glutamyl-gamma-aminobutyrate hydrolase PuuD
MAKPLVGVTSYVEDARWGHWSSLAALTPFAYVRALSAAGARPVQLPPDADAAEETLDVLDGLVVTGGVDIDPAFYGAEEHPEMPGTRPERDRAEAALVEGALERDMPVLAICRGSQLLNVLRGGDVVQHLEEEPGTGLHGNGAGATVEHELVVKSGSRLAALVGESTAVRSEHHQGFGRIGDGLVEVAWAPDGTVEALEDPTRRFALAVIWHPERGDDLALFHALVDQAAGYASERRR